MSTAHAAPVERLIKAYSLPDYCDCQEVVMRELTGLDTIQAAAAVDRLSMRPETITAQVAAERTEAIRISLVEVDGRPVNVDGVPFAAMDEWSQRTMAYLIAFFEDLNGVESSAVKNAVAAGRIVSSPAMSRPAATHTDE